MKTRIATEDAMPDSVQRLVRRQLPSPESLADPMLVQVMEKYTFVKPCAVGGPPDPDDTDPHTIWLKFEHQSFHLDGYQGTKEDAEYIRYLLAQAIVGIVRAMTPKEGTYGPTPPDINENETPNDKLTHGGENQNV